MNELYYLAKSDGECYIVNRVLISEVAGNGGVEVELNAPVTLSEEFGSKYVTFYVSDNSDDGSLAAIASARKDGFQVFMSASRDRSHLPSMIEPREHRQLIATERLYNQVIQYMKSAGVGFTCDSVGTVGTKVARVLKNALWYIDTAHQQFHDRSIHLPDVFKEFQGFNDYKKNRKSKPRMTPNELDEHAEALAGLLLLPSLSASNCKKLKTDIEQLSTCLRAYAAYLRKHSEQQAETHHSLVPLRDPSVNSVASIVIASSRPLEPCYVELQSHLNTPPLYEPVCIDEFVPSDRFLRRKYISQLSLSVDVYIYRMAYGGSIGTVTFVWKIDQKLSDHEQRNALTITKMLPKYATRDMKNTFIKKYAEVSKTPIMVLRNIFRELTSDASAASSSDEAEIDDRVAHFVLLADDPDVILDLRVLNGQPGSTRFDLFWNECQKFFDEHVAAVSERRHGDYLYLPFAISVEDLLQQIKAHLPVDTPIPSSEWLRLQFWPTDPYRPVAVIIG